MCKLVLVLNRLCITINFCTLTQRLYIYIYPATFYSNYKCLQTYETTLVYSVKVQRNKINISFCGLCNFVVNKSTKKKVPGVTFFLYYAKITDKYVPTVESYQRNRKNEVLFIREFTNCKRCCRTGVRVARIHRLMKQIFEGNKCLLLLILLIVLIRVCLIIYIL